MVVDVEVTADEAELVTDLLFGLGATAVAEAPAATGGLVLTAELPDDTDLSVLGRPVLPHRFAPVEDPPTRAVAVGPVVVHHPDAPPPPGLVPVAIDPTGAFGHGDHPTTRLALAAVVTVTPGTTVLDVGSGTGVLAVAAALLGARVRAVDTDPAAVAATAANARRNEVAERVTADGTPVDELTGAWDLVVANVLVTAHRALARVLPRLVATGGRLVLSGLLPGQLDEVLALLPPWPVVRARDGQWAAATLHRPAGGVEGPGSA
ncbi:MAG: 50S ribosomal protein L11 methyltransferase [Acidimicrobiales bacterium]|nr:50S ribosomal protein L11 methyltransferase [Acidimicrobiales bacterium]